VADHATQGGADKGSGAKSFTDSQQALQVHYRRYTEGVARAREEAARKYMDLLSRLGDAVRKVQQDLSATDPSTAFTTEVLRALKLQDTKQIFDAQVMLANNILMTQSAAAKRLREALNVAQDEYLALYEDLRRLSQSYAQEYATSVIEDAKGMSPTALDRTAMAVLGHGLLVGAMTMPDPGVSRTA